MFDWTWNCIPKPYSSLPSEVLRLCLVLGLGVEKVDWLMLGPGGCGTRPGSAPCCCASRACCCCWIFCCSAATGA